MPDDEYAICPYNKNHEILVFRMPAHILKCRKSYQGPPLETCIFNAAHLVPQGTMKEHIKVCNNARIFNEPIYRRNLK